MDAAIFRRSRLLAGLPSETWARIRPDLSLVELARGEIILAPGDPADSVLFPRDGLATLLGQDDTGSSVDVAVLGRDEVLGAYGALADLPMPTETIQLIAGQAARMPAATFRRAMDREPALRRSVARRLAALFAEVAQNATCNRLHGLGPRVARWLLTLIDRAEVDELALTQEGLARMAGASRPKVSQAVNALVAAGAIETRRSRIRVVDRGELEAQACVCYSIVRDTHERLTEP